MLGSWCLLTWQLIVNNCENNGWSIDGHLALFKLKFIKGLRRFVRNFPNPLNTVLDFRIFPCLLNETMGKCPLECEMIDHHQDSVKSVNFYPSQHCLKSFNITLLPTSHPSRENSTHKYTQQNNKNTPNKQPIPKVFFFVCDNFPLFHKHPLTSPLPSTILKQFFK